MESQQRTHARTTRRVAAKILAGVLGLIGCFCLFSSTARAAVDFAFTVTPTTLYLPPVPGSTASYTLNFSPIPGTDTKIVTVSGLPSGVGIVGTLPIDLGVTPTTGTLTLGVAGLTVPGNYYPIAITCQDTSGTYSQNVTLIVVGPVPFIDSMSPLSTAPGPGSFTLTVYGTGFVNGFSQIYWNYAATGNTTTCSSTSCSVLIPSGHITSPGTAFVTVVDPGQHGAVSNVFFFTIIGSTPSVRFSRTDYAAGHGPSSVAVGVFTSSGRLDLAVANKNDNTVSILLGNGDGTFTPQTHSPFSTGGYTPVSVAVGDFNNDGYLDIAVVNACGDTLSCTSLTTGTVGILLGDGTGNFTLKSNPSTLSTGKAPTFVAVGDFNGDGNLDLAVANGTDGDLSILLGNGDGTFYLKSSPPTGSNPSWIAVGDFNNDGIPDLAVANTGTVTSRGTTVTVLKGNGDGTFTAFPSSPILSEGLSPTAVAVGQFAGSGNLDLAVANACGTDTTCSSVGKVAVLTGNGAAVFTLASNTAAGPGPSALAVADLNGDGFLDVAVANETGSSVSILLGDGTGNLTLQTSPASPTTNSSPVSIAIGDFNGDGGMDLVTANANAADVSVLLEAPSVALACALSEPAGTTCTLLGPPTYAPNLAFGSEPEGGSVGPMTVTLTNSSNLLLSVTSYGITSGATNFALDASTTCATPPFTIAAGADCTIAVDFKPQSLGVLGGLVEISDDAPGSPQVIYLKGTGTASAVSVSPTNLAFGNVTIPGPSPAQLVKLTNSSGTQITSISYSATSPFTAQPNGTDGSTCGTSLNANSSCYIAVTFSPSTTGFQSGTLTINDTFGVTALVQTVNLNGTGVQAVASATPGSLTFTNQVYGSTSVAQPVILSNSGAGALTGVSISLGGADPGEFSQTSDCGTTVPPYGNCTIYVTFTPSVTGLSAQTATLSIAYTGGSIPVYLSGTGIKANTSSMITSNTPNPSTVGLPVTVTFAVTATPPGIGTPTGSVTVSDGTGDTCTGSLTLGAGGCSLPILTPSTPGPKPLTASYLGDPNFNTSVSAAVAQTVLKANTTTSITSAIPSSLVVGQPVTVNFKVTPPAGDSLTPTGKVNVSDAAGDSCVAILSSGTGSCVLTPSTSGPETLTATYLGDSNFNSSTTSLSNALAVADFSISISPKRASLKPGTTTSFTLTLIPLGGFTGTVALTCSDPHLYTTCTLSSNSVPLATKQLVKVQVYSPSSPIMPGTTVLTLTGKSGTGNPISGGLTHTAEALINMPQAY
jgi:hypothetical protein